MLVNYQVKGIHSYIQIIRLFVKLEHQELQLQMMMKLKEKKEKKLQQQKLLKLLQQLRNRQVFNLNKLKHSVFSGCFFIFTKKKLLCAGFKQFI